MVYDRFPNIMWFVISKFVDNWVYYGIFFPELMFKALQRIEVLISYSLSIFPKETNVRKHNDGRMDGWIDRSIDGR